jgi:hypothetical protein
MTNAVGSLYRDIEIVGQATNNNERKTIALVNLRMVCAAFGREVSTKQEVQ